MGTVSTTNAPRVKWVTAQVFAEVYGLRSQTLSNWRYQDRKAGRTEAAPGHPVYRRFGKAVRYPLASDELV